IFRTRSVGWPRCVCSVSKPGSSRRSLVMPEREPARHFIVLALDFGLKRIGIASGDTLTRSAHPRGTVANGPGGPDWAALQKLIADLRPARMAVGEPYNADGSASAFTETARRF